MRWLFGAIFLIRVAWGLEAKDKIVSRCSILSGDRKVLRQYPGHICDFLPDGRLLTYTTRYLRLLSAENRTLWGIHDHFHHQLQFNRKKDAILAMSSEVHEEEVGKVRYDVLKILDMRGEVQKAFRFYTHRQELKRLARNKELGSCTDIEVPGVPFEFSHANSFFEINTNVLAKHIPAFKEGNYLINSNLLGLLFVVDRDLKKILWSFQYPDSLSSNLHDAQILENGHLLVYNNEVSDGQKEYSTLDEYDLVARKRVWRYMASPPDSFSAKVGGGVQRLKSGNFFYSDLTKVGRFVEVTPQGQQVWSFENPFVDDSGEPVYIQQAKVVEVEKFLQANGGY